MLMLQFVNGTKLEQNNLRVNDMANDLAFLATRMQAIANTVERNAVTVVKEVAKAIAPVLVYATPVDTSRARVNWQAGIGTIPSDVLFPQPSKPPSADYGGQVAVAAIIATANQYAGGSYLAIANNAPYIQRLNRGWSSQAPSAFVQKAVVVGIMRIRGFKVLSDVN